MGKQEEKLRAETRVFAIFLSVYIVELRFCET
jgi:hypothetical protein